jgi:hypothetical protein
MSQKRIKHEITLIAWNADGASIMDIVETAHKYASKFYSRWLRDPDIGYVSAMRPGAYIASARMREIQR